MKAVDYVTARHAMVQQQIAARGVRSQLVLNAMRRVPREAFLAESVRRLAYQDSPLPIPGDQTISQPYMVAFMIGALDLRGHEQVLEVGGGCGYAAAVLGEIVGQVYTVERIPELASQATATLRSLDYENVKVVVADGSRGLAQYAPYDAIVVAASAPTVPEALKSQLRVGGRLVIPVGEQAGHQELVKIIRESESEFSSAYIADVRFVPLIADDVDCPPTD